MLWYIDRVVKALCHTAADEPNTPRARRMYLSSCCVDTPPPVLPPNSKYSDRGKHLTTVVQRQSFSENDTACFAMSPRISSSMWFAVLPK